MVLKLCRKFKILLLHVVRKSRNTLKSRFYLVNSFGQLPLTHAGERCDEV